MTPAERSERGRRYYAEHREELVAYNREYMRTRRRLLRSKAAAFARAWASLHELPCHYPEKGCSCRAVLLVAS